VTAKLERTTSAEVAKAMQAERRRAGAVTFGVVLTLVVVVDPDGDITVERARAVATSASLAHPCRVLLVVPVNPTGKARLDAEVSVGGDQGPGESVVLWLYGPLVEHADSVVLPLLAPDTPVVTWWAGPPPPAPRSDPLGALASRRITDTYLAQDQRAALELRSQQYSPGDTDLAWTRDTLWRSTLAAVVDELPGELTSARVVTERGNPSAALLASWLQVRLGVEVDVVDGPGPAITSVSVSGPDLLATVERPDGVTARLVVTGQADRVLPLPIRPLAELLAEELQHLDADEIYAESLAAISRVGPGSPA
jgi:glucose-6-phosphate dehydrogenase assembly protein OpcA